MACEAMDRFICLAERTDGVCVIIMRATEDGYFRDRRREEHQQLWAFRRVHPIDHLLHHSFRHPFSVTLLL